MLGAAAGAARGDCVRSGDSGGLSTKGLRVGGVAGTPSAESGVWSAARPAVCGVGGIADGAAERTASAISAAARSRLRVENAAVANDLRSSGRGSSACTRLAAAGSLMQLRQKPSLAWPGVGCVKRTSRRSSALHAAQNDLDVEG